MSNSISSPLLLSQSDSIESKQPPPPPPPLSLDETIERCIGDFSWVQFLQTFLVSLAWFFDAQQTFISVFTDVEPTWHCTQLGDESCNSASSDICQLSNNSWSWDFPVHTSIISEWGLECASSLVKGLPASSFFMGCLAGGFILATLADSSLGRKNTLFLSCLIMSLSSLLTIFSTNVWIYSVLRFVNGFGRTTIGTCAIVLSTELVGKKWRGQVGTIGYFCFALGFLSLPAIAYINRGSSWRTLYFWTSTPTFLYSILVPFLVRESPRWLFVQGRTEEAVLIIKSIASTNQNISRISFSNLCCFERETRNNVDHLYTAIKILVEKNWSFRRLLVVMVAGFGMGMVYYGMPLGLGNLSFNLYLSVTLNALSELPSSLVTFFIIGKLRRRSSLLGFTILSGICSVMCIAAGKVSATLQIGLELVSYFSACTALDLMLIYTLELFPTCVRNSALSLLRQAVVLGGAISPVLVAAGRKNGFLSFGVFGLMIGICGLFVISLPETRDRPISDTMDEEEYKFECDNIS
ncbi:hypothetical protein LWI29_019683 [Acer saccharum]|uniref:Major facilitator superfamily (MFS) profile domain-containing protein n=1 Tax=Acer saccharum TaxID=4024 RepID=A0AA39VS48_ACESA|nr:hypothetical protein LWI29_019683 [Acer saccharum]KAK1578183.1 hypothetical protein Q3G72_028233 [Acer saccharum]